MQRNKDGDLKFIFVYQGYFTKLISLQSLKTKSASEVAYNRTDIFVYLEYLELHIDYYRTMVESL